MATLYYGSGSTVFATYKTIEPPVLFKVHLEDEDGDEFCCEFGGVDFAQERFISYDEAEKALTNAVKTDDCNTFFPPIKAYIHKELAKFNIKEVEERVKRFKLERV